MGRGFVGLVGLLLVACNPSELAEPGMPTPSDSDETSSTGTPEPAGSSTGDEAASSSSGSADSATEAGPDWPEPDIPGEPGDCYFGEQCPDDGKCVPRTTVEDGPVWSVCAPVVRDPVSLGGACSSYPTVEDMPVDDCDSETYCVVTDAELQTGTCMRLCGIEEGLGGPPPDPSVCDGGQGCQPVGAIIHVCSDACDPLAPSCAEGFGCYATGDGAVCLPSGAAAAGEACPAINDCEAGATCLAGDVVPACDSPACCAPFCDTSLPDTCDAELAGTTCIPLGEGASDNLGACMAP